MIVNHFTEYKAYFCFTKEELFFETDYESVRRSRHDTVRDRAWEKLVTRQHIM